MKKIKKIKINQDKCIGCGLCVITAPNTFELDSKTGKSKVKNIKGDSEEKIKKAEENCPVNAIEIEY
jgi:ferredoxin